MKNEIDVIRDLADKFAQGRIDYMLTGWVAMNYYAQPRMTPDIDVVFALEPPDAGASISLRSYAVERKCSRKRGVNSPKCSDDDDINFVERAQVRSRRAWRNHSGFCSASIE